MSSLQVSDPQPGAEPVQVTVNGKARSIAPGTSVAQLLATLELRSDRVAVELDRAIVRRAEHADTRLAGGEVLEVVTLVGGG